MVVFSTLHALVSHDHIGRVVDPHTSWSSLGSGNETRADLAIGSLYGGDQLV